MDAEFFKQTEYEYFRIDRIAMQNFRCFGELAIDLNRMTRKVFIAGQPREVAPLTVIVAKNGMGKTTVLDAIRIAYGNFTSGFSYKSPVNIQARDIRIEADNSTMALPVVIEAVAEIEKSWYEWSRIVKHEGERAQTRFKEFDGNPFKDFAQKAKEAASPDSFFTLPLIASYGTNRLWKRTNKPDKRRTLVTNRMWGYNSCLDAASNYKDSFSWINGVVMARLNTKYAGIREYPVFTLQLQAIESALRTVLESEGYFPGLHFDPLFNELSIVQGRWGEGLSVPVSKLSDGVRAVFFMVADIAFRCAKLNPQLGEDAIRLTPGIVLIDEVDLHLHPSWQQTILGTLQWAFPQIQFIVTTHSPQVVSSIPKECIRIIDDGKIIPFDMQTQGVESQNILAQIFGTNPALQQDPFVQKLEKYARLEAAGLADSEDALRQQLIQHFGEQYPPLQRIEIHRKFFANRKGGKNA